jgi:hypothetical protein
LNRGAGECRLPAVLEVLSRSQTVKVAPSGFICLILFAPHQPFG